MLVHGAWADGSSWSKIIPLLQAKGLHVVAVQNPLSSIAVDVASTSRLINAQDGPVLLVGHSYGGAVITEAGNNPKVAGLVYVAAFAPDERELVLAAQGATQNAILSTPTKKAAWHTKLSWFVIASHDQVIWPEQEISTAKRMGAKTLTLSSSHLPMLSHPKEVAELVREAASSVGTNAVATAAR